MSNAVRKIKKSIRLLSEAGEKKLASDLLCALAAITDTEQPRTDLTYSSTMRELRNKHEDSVREFQVSFKNAFEEALDSDLENPEQLALMEALQKIDVEL